MEIVEEISQKNPKKMIDWEQMENLLLLRHTDCASTTASGLRVLTADTETPVVTHTSVGADLLESLQVLTQF